MLRSHPSSVQIVAGLAAARWDTKRGRRLQIRAGELGLCRSELIAGGSEPVRGFRVRSRERSLGFALASSSREVRNPSEGSELDSRVGSLGFARAELIAGGSEPSEGSELDGRAKQGGRGGSDDLHVQQLPRRKPRRSRNDHCAERVRAPHQLIGLRAWTDARSRSVRGGPPARRRSRR